MNSPSETIALIEEKIKGIQDAPDVETIKRIFINTRAQLQNLNHIPNRPLGTTSTLEDKLFLVVMERHQQLAGTPWKVDNADLAAQIPPKKELLSALKKLHILNEVNRGFYELLATTWAGKALTAVDLVSIWQSTIRKYFNSFGSAYYQNLQLDRNFSDVVRVICPNPVVVQAALDLKRVKDAENKSKSRAEEEENAEGEQGE